MSKMETRKYRVSFTTPAFLGNAEQGAQWRTPPFKALLRQWWRVAYASGQGFDIDPSDMLHEEGRLFGHAWLKKDVDEKGKSVAARKSLVRIRLQDPEEGDNGWRRGTQKGVSPLPSSIDYGYAWFGLINRGNGQLDRDAIKSVQDSSREGLCILDLAFPETCADRLDQIITLVHAFGQLGSRSRGGWGGVHIDDVTPLSNRELLPYSRPWKSCLTTDWALSLASDENGPWIWQSRIECDRWVDLMKVVARNRKQVRTALKALHGRDLRRALGFASGSHRMPSPLRWKPFINLNGKLQLRVFAMPHRIPETAGQGLLKVDLERAWKKVCEVLDDSSSCCERTT